MARLRHLLLRLLHACQPSRGEAEVQRELASHLALLEDDLQRRGLSPSDAHTAARKTIGGAAQIAAAHRDARAFRWADELRVDLRYAVRRLRHRPGASALAILMLSLAVGLSTAMFTLVDKLLITPVPFPHADRLAQLVMFDEHGGSTMVSPEVIHAWRDSGAIERAEGLNTTTLTVDTIAGPLARQSAYVPPGLLELVDARPMLGRLPTMNGGSEEIVLSEDLWRTAFRADVSVIGHAVTLSSRPAVVVGVMPATFRFPYGDTSVWIARDFTASPNRAPSMAFVRFAPGISRADALKVATDRAHAADVSTSTRRAMALSLPTGRSAADSYYERAVPFMAGAVVFVAIVLCMNVAGLLLTRLHTRRREFAMCTALGASRARLLRQAAVESVILGVCGAAAGVGLAWTLVSLGAHVLLDPFLRLSLNPAAGSLDHRALAGAAIAGLFATMAAGLVPAWLGTRLDTQTTRINERLGTETRRGRLTMRVLLISEVAFACALLCGATTLSRSFVNLAHVDRGFDPSGIVTLRVAFDPKSLPTPDARRDAAASFDREMRQLPGVRQTAWSSGVPLNAGDIYFGDWTTDRPGATGLHAVIETFAASPAYMDLYGIHLLKGRRLTADDSGAVIVGERLAAQLFPDGESVGHVFSGDGQTFRVVGVAHETRRSLIDSDRDPPDMYLPFKDLPRYPTFSLRCDDTCPSEGVIRQRAFAVPGVNIDQVMRMDEAFAEDLAQPRASAAFVVMFALVALIAAGGGLFGVLSHAVQQRRREFGVRAALGASPQAIARIVIHEGLLVSAVGLALGGLLAQALASTMASLEYGVTVADPVTSFAVVLTILTAVLAALWQPTHTAARTDPARLLRED